MHFYRPGEQPLGAFVVTIDVPLKTTCTYLKPSRLLDLRELWHNRQHQQASISIILVLIVIRRLRPLFRRKITMKNRTRTLRLAENLLYILLPSILTTTNNQIINPLSYSFTRVNKNALPTSFASALFKPAFDQIYRLGRALTANRKTIAALVFLLLIPSVAGMSPGTQTASDTSIAALYVIAINICGAFLKKKMEIKRFLAENKPAIIFFFETGVIASESDYFSKLTFDGYTMHHIDAKKSQAINDRRKCKNSRGTILLVSNQLTEATVRSTMGDSEAPCLAVNLRIKGKRHVIWGMHNRNDFNAATTELANLLYQAKIRPRYRSDREKQNSNYDQLR